MKCTLCEKYCGDIDLMIDEGWIPSFWVGGSDPDGPNTKEEEFDICCPECCEKYLEQGYDGEWQLKPELESTFYASASCLPEGFI